MCCGLANTLAGLKETFEFCLSPQMYSFLGKSSNLSLNQWHQSIQPVRKNNVVCVCMKHGSLPFIPKWQMSSFVEHTIQGFPMATSMMTRWFF